MKLKIVLWIIGIMFLLIPTVSAYTQQEILDNVILSWYPSVNESNDNSTEKRTAAVTANSVVMNTTTQKVGSAAGYFNGVAEPLTFAADAHMNNVLNFTVCVILTHTNEGAKANMLAERVSGSIGTMAAGDFYFYLNDIYDTGVESAHFDYYGTSDFQSLDTGFKTKKNADRGYSLCGVLNITGTTAYSYLILNGTVIASASQGGITPTSTNNALSIGDMPGQNNIRFIGQMEDFYYINLSLTTDDISTHIFNGGNFLKLAPAAPPDTTPPTSDATALNNSAPKISEDVNPSAKFTDETSLSSIWASYNITGTWANFSSTNFTGTVLTGNFSPNITNTLSRGNVVGLKFTANDTNGNSIQSSIFTYAVADTLGTIKLQKNMSTIRVNDVINITGNISEMDGDIDWGMVLNNQSGASVNTTYDLNGYNANFSQAITITAVKNAIINFTVWYNDTANNIYTNSTLITVADTLGSISIGTSLTTIKINNVINVSGNITEPDNNIAFCMIAHNQSGAMVNTSFAGSGSNYNCSQKITVTLVRANVINFTVFYNDTYGTQSQNSTKITVSDTTPTAYTTDSLTPNSPVITNTLTGLCTGSTDADGDTITPYYRFYDITDGAERQAYSATATYALVSPTDSHDQFRIDCKAQANSQFSDELIGTDLETVQNTNPTQANIMNTTNQYRNKNITINITPSTDADLDTLTYFWYRNSSTDNYPNLVASGTTITSYTTNETSEGTYWYFVNVSDGYINITGNMWSFTLDIPVVTPTNLNWKTTGGFTSGTRTYNEILDWVNATCLNTYGLQSCNITITDPNNNIAINNASMALVNSNIYSYSTDLTLNKAGTWTLRVDSNDNSSVSSASTTIVVQTQNLTTQDGWYGYTQNNILSESDIDSIVSYDYTILEFSINASRIQSDFKQLLNSTNHSNSKNIRVGINILLDFNYSVQTEKNNFYNNLSSNFSKLNNDPYEDTIEYITLSINNATEYSDGDKYGVLNNASQNLTAVTNNKFRIYSKNYQSASLDTAYIQNTTLKYVDAQTHTDWIKTENNLMRNSTTLNRIYNINGTLKDSIKSFQDNIMATLRGTPVITTTVGNKSVAEISNGDFVVFNNESSNRLYYLNFSNVSDILGKDLWDYTNKIYIHSNTNGTGDINVSAYSATMVFAEDFDHIQGTWTLFKTSSSGEKTFNYTTDNVNDGNYALDVFSNKFKIELFDPHYNINTFITYYGWFNASYINNWSVYSIVIFDDENPHELARILANDTTTDFYGYISVADYVNTGAWQLGKQVEVDNIIALNDSTKINIFLDGLDTGIGGTNFSTQFKTLSDYIKITKNRKVGLNTYTAYDDFCTYSAPDGFCMKESCIRRWNGTSASSPTAYDWEDWSLEMNKSIWYKSHNVDVLCQAFDNRTMDTFEIYNNTRLQDIYFASKVLGYTDFYVSQPDFNYAHTEYVYNVGTDLANSFSTNDNQTYYRRYSNGIVYYNSSSNHGWFDDGRTQDVQACFKLYDNSDGAGDEEKDFQFSVNNMTNDNVPRNQYTIPATTITAGVWNWYCVKINETHESTTGSYKIEGSTSNTGQVADGIFLGWESNLYTGRHSWWSNIAGTAVWNAYSSNQNWEVKIIVNETKKASVDTFTTQITQTQLASGGKTNVTLSSNNPFDIEVWSEPTTISRFINLSYFDGTNYQRVYPANTSTCNSNNPSWNSTTINGEVHKSCIETTDTTTIVRVATPHLSTQTYQIQNNEVPVVTIIKPVENALYNQQPLNISYVITDANGDAITQVKIYINDTLNQTISGNSNTTLNASDDNYNLSISAFDGSDWGNNATISLFHIDTVRPLIGGMPSNATINNSNFNATATFSDPNLYGTNCTTYNGNTNLHSIVFSQEFTNILITTQAITLEYNTSWGDGEKLTICRASDDHTKKELGIIDYDINDGLIDELLGKKDGVVFKKGTNLGEDVTIVCEEDADDVEVYKLEDRYSILFDYSKSKTKEKEKLNTYNCYLKTTSKTVYRNQSKYPAHFVLGNGIGETAVDYVFKNNQNTTYIITKQSDGYKVVINTIENVLNFSSILGVNIAESNSTVIMDANAPTINSFNLTNAVNNTFYKVTNISVTINATDLFLRNITIYANNKSNITVLAINGSNKVVVNLTTDGNYTLIAEAKDMINSINSSYFYNVVVDTTLPTFIEAVNRTTANSTNILDNTDVNLSVFGIGDIYLNTGIFSYNISNGTWYNITSFNQGNGTYHTVINKNNLTAGMVGGWKFHVYDLAGNELDPIYTFTVGSTATPTATTYGGFSSPAEQTASITSSMNEKLCLQSAGFDWFDDTCYECDGKITKRNEQLLCVSCVEGYALVGQECKAINPQESNIVKKAREISIIDKYLNKFFPDNPFLGLLIIVLGLGVVGYGVVNREKLIKRF